MQGPCPYPPLDLGYLRILTDDTGLIQHATFAVPNRPSGYTTDDNARALVVAAQDYERAGSRESLRDMAVYLSFLFYALTPDNRFHNLMAYERRWMDARGSEDSHGRALWAAGYVATAAVPQDIRRAARQVFDDSIPWATDFRSPRAIAFALLGACACAADPERAGAMSELARRLAGRLMRYYERARTSDWDWFEHTLAYSNAMLPYALLQAGSLVGEEKYLKAAAATLDFLVGVTVVDGILQPVGCHGWYVRGGNRALFDQQPVDAAGMVMTCIAAWRVLGDERYRDLALLAFDWFFGRNVLGACLVNTETGGCHDGLTAEGVNRNQGAESQVSYLLSHLAVLRAGLV